MNTQTTLLDSMIDHSDALPNVEIIIRRVRYNRIRIPSSDKVVFVVRDERTARRLMKEKKNWIEKKLAQMKEMEEATKIENGKFYYLGELRDESELYTIKNFRKELFDHADYYLKQNTPVQPRLSIRRMRSKLGLYSAKKDEIKLSAYLVFLPKNLIDYIIFHELTHREIRNHRREFWETIAKRYPDWKQKEKEVDRWWFRVKKQISIYNKLRNI